MVGHSYGGAVITTAGNNSLVRGLVYIAAHAPDQGESDADNGKISLAAYKSLIKGNDDWDYISPKMFAADFEGDQPKLKAGFIANSQTPTADVDFMPSFKIQPGRQNLFGIW